MRILPKLMLPLLVLGLGSVPSVAQAQARNGNFNSKFEVVVDNCGGSGATLNKAAVAITLTGPSVLIKIPNLPDMKGKPGKRGRLRATGKDGGDDDLRTEFSFSGRVHRGKLQAVLVAEFFKGDKPQCTQSWSVSGTRSAK